MEALFETVLGMSATASLVILAVLLARLALGRAPKRFSYVLWAVVLFRLLCPVTIESAFSLLPSARVVSVAGRGESPAQVVRVDTGVPDLDQPVNDFFVQHPYQGQPALPAADAAVPEPVPAPVLEQSGPPADWRTVPATVWLVGAALLLGYSLFSLLRLRRRLVGSVPLAGERGVRLADHIPSPFVLGIVRPVIYLPSGLPEREWDYILLHERTHIRRLDHLFRALAWLALAVHWFNPLVWLAFHLAGKDMEMSCDEAVLRKMGRDVRADYSSSLLRLSVGGRLPAGPLAFGGGGAQSRIKNVLSYKKPALWVTAAALIAVACAGVALATDQSSLHIDPDSVTAVSDSTRTFLNTEYVSHTARRDDLFDPDSPYVRILAEEDGKELVRLINTYRKTVYRQGDPKGDGLDDWVRISCQDGGYYLVHYYYWSSFCLDPFHPGHGEDDYVTLVTHYDASGEAGTTWRMECEFDDALLDWMDKTAGSRREPSPLTSYEPGLAEVWVASTRGMEGGYRMETQLEEYPGVTFRLTSDKLTAVSGEEELVLFDGMPIWDVYLCDLDGDGKRELCSCVSIGSGIVDDRIRVFDYQHRALYELEDRMVHDYVLRFEGNQLWAEERDYVDGMVLHSGRLVLTEDGLDIREKVGAIDLPSASLTFTRKEDAVRIDGAVGDVELPRGAFWDPERDELTMVYPPFTDGIEGHVAAAWADESRTSVTLSTKMMAMLSSLGDVGYWEFTVDLHRCAVTNRVPRDVLVPGPTRVYPGEISEEEMIKAARVAAKLLTAAADYCRNAGQTVPAQAEPAYALNKLGNGVFLTGLDAKSVFWCARSLTGLNGSRTGVLNGALGYLALEDPRFLGGYFAQGEGAATALYRADESGELLWLGYDDYSWSDEGRDYPGQLCFTVDLSDGSVVQRYVSNMEGYRPVVSNEEMTQAARTLAQLIQGAADWYAEASDPPPEDGPLPVTQPMRLWFGSGAGAWSTIITLHPDGSFEGEFSDTDMGGYNSSIQYICRFHGRFGDIRSVTPASWSMTLEELVLDTGREIGEEWTGRSMGWDVRYIASGPYGFDDAEGDPLEPGAQFVFYSPEARVGGPETELYAGLPGIADFLHWAPQQRRDLGLWETLDCYGLLNVATGCGFFDLHAWGIE